MDMKAIIGALGVLATTAIAEMVYLYIQVQILSNEVAYIRKDVEKLLG